ncbi:transposable element Tcb1 transposase [Trichonephila clavipes]|nr:transposable element Tcb1 transposase [Trichonephila clavipes]
MQTILITGVPKILCRVPLMARLPLVRHPFSTATGRQVSRFTVARRLHKGGLFARRPVRCLPLKVDHRRHRLQWCREHKNWTTVNGVVSSLRMRVGSVQETILNAF